MTLKTLIKKVRKIDANAAKYLEDEAPLLNSYAHTIVKRRDLALNQLFVWSEAPQGGAYWKAIHESIS